MKKSTLYTIGAAATVVGAFITGKIVAKRHELEEMESAVVGKPGRMKHS